MLLTMKEKARLETVQAIMDERINVTEASIVLGISVRQVYRVLASVRKDGLAGVRHRRCGQPAWNRSDDALWETLLALVRARYTDVNDRHLQEILLREHGIEVNHETLRRHLRAAGCGPKRKRRSRKYRSRRDRRAASGMLLQIDGSRHDWLEGRAPQITLVGAKDDATGHVWALFAEAETSRAYFELLRSICLSHGLPMALYSDRHTIFHNPREPTIIEQLNNSRSRTQFGRAMQEIGVSIIKAYSPQAKGRIERQWGVFQDRLVVELRLACASTLEEANAVLRRFLCDYNQRFSVQPQQQQDVWRTAPPIRQLDRILCIKETRQVANDHIVGLDGLRLQIPMQQKKFYSLAKARVEVLVLRDSSVEIYYQQHLVARYSPQIIAQLLQDVKAAKHRSRHRFTSLTP